MKLLFFFAAIFFISNLNFNYCQTAIDRATFLDSSVNVFMYNLPEELDSLSSQFYDDGTFEIKESSTVNKDTILGYLNLDTETSFALSRISPSRFVNNAVFKFYEQFYNGVKVSGGGITIKKDTISGKIISFSPYIYSNLNINATPSYTQSQLEDYFDTDTLHTYNLEIFDISGDFRLVWYCKVVRNNSMKLIWIDAHTGDELNEIDGDPEIDAITHTYGTLDLNDKTENGITSMVWPNNTLSNSLRVFEGYTPLSIDPLFWPEHFIPETENSTWGEDANIISRQVFYTADEVISAFKDEADIEFGNVRIMTDLDYSGAKAFDGSSSAECYCIFGLRVGIPTAVFDVTAHELAHCYLYNFLDYNQVWANKALHEGIADIFGCYIEDFMPGPENNERVDYTNDWIIGGDEPDYANIINRDLSEKFCFHDIEPLDKAHKRGLVIGHWFYSIVTGIIEDDIPALGMETAIKILIESLHSLSNRMAGFGLMKAKTLVTTAREFGTCSPEYRAVVNAWARVCLPGSSEPCICEPDTPPQLTDLVVNNDCPKLFVDLNDYYDGTLPENTILMWSPNKGTQPLPDPIVDPIIELHQTNTTFYAFYYDEELECISRPSAGIEVIIESCCNDTEDVYISGTVNYENPMSIGGNIYVRDQGILTISNFLEIGGDKGIFVEEGGKVVIEGPKAILTVCNPTTNIWNGISLEPGSELITRGGEILNVKNGIVTQTSTINFTQPLIDIKGIEIFGKSLSNSTGISLNNAQTINISGIKVQDFQRGINIMGGSGVGEFHEIYDSEFKNINSIGIVSSFTNTLIYGCTFENSTIGVYAFENNLGNINYCEFKDIQTALFSFSSYYMTITNSKMNLKSVPESRGVFGIQSPYLKLLNCPELMVNGVGISLFNSPNTIITNNFISKEDNTSQTATGGAVSLVNCSNSNINYNTIYTERSLSGIEANNSHSSNIFNNNIITDLGSAGINLHGSMGVTTFSNSVMGSYSGINLYNSAGNEISCNVVEDCSVGLYVGYNSEYQDILGNVLDNTEDLTIRSEIGIQPFHGNLFIGGVTRAIGLNAQQIQNSLFYVNSEYDYHMPTNSEPSQWFVDVANSGFYECPDGTNIPEELTPFSNDSLDLCQYYHHLKALDTLQPNKFFLGVFDLLFLSESRQDFSLPACISSDTDFQNLCGMQELAGVALDLDQLGQHELATDSLVSYQHQLLDIVDSTDRAQLISLIAGELDSLANDFQSTREQDSILLDSIYSDLNAISCSSTLVNTWKGIYHKYLSFLHTGKVDSADYNTLRQYSSLCSDIYGKPIHLARAVTATFDTTYYAQYDNCLQGMEQRIIREQTVETNIKVWPNPTTASVQIELPNKYSGEMTITDMLGRNLNTIKIENGSLDFVEMPGENGMYLLNFFSAGGQFEQHKIMVFK